MADEQVSITEATLVEADDLLRQRFGDEDIYHLILAIESDGTTVVRSNCGPRLLRHMAKLLVEIADQNTPPGDRRKRH